MPLKLRPTGLGSGIDKDISGGREVSRIFQNRGGPERASPLGLFSSSVDSMLRRDARAAVPPESVSSDDYSSHSSGGDEQMFGAKQQVPHGGSGD